MKKINLILILLMVLLSTTLVASAVAETEPSVAINPYCYFNQYQDGCYQVTANGNYVIDGECLPSCFEGLIPPTMNIVAEATVKKDGNTIEVKSFTSNPSIPYALSYPINVDIEDLKFPDGIDVWIANEKIGFTAYLIINEQKMPVTGTVIVTNAANGVYTFAFNELYINQIPITCISGNMQVTVEPINCEEEIPEFPTIAIPVAAIIGLAFFMQRRKD
ncbi:PEF-CTERM sorting domain-containing protein [Methanolobus bombayensis]|uniref:PEF-CTERM sorting domain-containing protein n=1 Tax=Methanolobus bombayensis TaxID=38023 RepID=UPI001FD7FD1A|nr:PEF-CTERM sorting domain-containing protein [Methanolobus bombayensis]MBP1908164.1 hypothetical protein [Methanolobus bombayensis]